jgi:hypothetical protein
MSSDEEAKVRYLNQIYPSPHREVPVGTGIWLCDI